MIGRIDTHSHLLPGVDDGCEDVTESIACARRMVEAGYTHSFCTPHIWPNLDNSIQTIAPRVQRLQAALDQAGVPLLLMPGGEMNISGSFCETAVDDLVSYNGYRKYALFDFWTDRLPPYFESCIKHIQDAGITPILAHPERIDAVQRDPDRVVEIAETGLLLQCNLECLGDPKRGRRTTLAEQWLTEGRYFMLGSDLHRLNSLDVRLVGLKRAIELVGEEKVWELTHTHPLRLMGKP
jgi:protein-tyrosine phosphatase